MGREAMGVQAMFVTTNQRLSDCHYGLSKEATSCDDGARLR